MIYIILGTKGQFIKMFPVMKALNERGVKYKFIHTGQHYGINEENRRRLGVRKPDVYLTDKKKNLANFKEFLFWAVKVLWRARRLNIRNDDYVVIHGDPESALLTLLIALYFRAKIVHVEAGLRSGDLFNPFPEELNRRITSFFAQICFCPTEKDASNISGRKKIYVTNGNTVMDAIPLALEVKPSFKVKAYLRKKYVLFITHRKENLFSEKNIKKIIGILEMILKRGHKVIWVLHENTKHELISRKFWFRVLSLQSKYDLQLEEHFLDYVDYMHLMKHSQFYASDGGSAQEEGFFLNRPVLILRKKTERDWGLGENAYLSDLNRRRVNYFLSHLNRFKRGRMTIGDPSEEIAEVLASL